MNIFLPMRKSMFYRYATHSSIMACSLQPWINPEGSPFGVSDEIPVFEVVLVIDFVLRTNYSNGRFQVPSIRGGAVPMKRKEVSSCLQEHVGISFSQSRHQTIQHYLDTTSSTRDKSLKTAARLRVQPQMVQTLMYQQLPYIKGADGKWEEYPNHCTALSHNPFPTYLQCMVWPLQCNSKNATRCQSGKKMVCC